MEHWLCIGRRKYTFVSIYVINSFYVWNFVIVNFIKMIQQWAPVTASTVVLRFASKTLSYYRITTAVCNNLESDQ